MAKTLHGDLDAIVLKALGKTPESRYATAQSFADDLQRWLRKEPVSAQPDKLGYRTRRLLARRWPLIVTTTAVSLVLITTTAVAVVQAIEARRSSQTAQDETRKALAVTAFLKDLFKNNGNDQADPAAAVEQQEGKHAHAKDRLQLALARISSSPDRPWLREWEAKLQELLGVSLLALGETAAAQRSLEQALELYKQVLDPKTSLHVGRVAMRLANLHKQAGRASVAKPLQAQSDAIRRKHPMFEQWIL